jgi:hypothetical protein
MTDRSLTKAQQSRQRRTRRQRLITLGALGLLLAAWLYGYFTQGQSVEPLVPAVVPSAVRTEPRGDIFLAYNSDNQLVGYAGVGRGSGYGGPVDMLVGLSPEGTISGVKVVAQHETPGFFRRLPEEGFFAQFLGKEAQAKLRLGQDLDAASGATVSSEAVAASIRQEVRELASSQLNIQVPAEREPLQVGAPELVLVALFVAGFLGHRARNPQRKKWVRRITLLTGAIVLGFIYNKPLTLANFISLASGYWPDWHNNLYWFLLLGGLLFVTTAQGKNPYCSWFCPFGAVQEGLAGLTGAKLYRPRRWHQTLQWVQRGLAFSAVLLGLALRQPGAASFEPFGALFNQTGSTAQWIMLVLVLLGSLVLYRPFCTYICPLDPVVDYIGDIRRWAQGSWRRLRA